MLGASRRDRPLFVGLSNHSRFGVNDAADRHPTRRNLGTGFFDKFEDERGGKREAIGPFLRRACMSQSWTK